MADPGSASLEKKSNSTFYLLVLKTLKPTYVAKAKLKVEEEKASH